MKEENYKGGIDDDGHYRCFFCGGIVCHNGSDMACDIYDESGPDDVLHYMSCQKCGAEYEVIQHLDANDTSMGDELRLRKKILCDGDQEENPD